MAPLYYHINQNLHIERIIGMRIGFIGLGKLGMPCALAISLKGHDVMGFDVCPEKMQKETFGFCEQGPNGEPSIEPLLQKSDLQFGSMRDVVRHSEIIFVAVQTPHDARYEGVTRLPAERIDFNYEYLIGCIHKLSRIIHEEQKDTIVVIISTVLPGTLRKYILPLLNDHVKLCYNPFFIAMGTAMTDFYKPEFVLFGVVDEGAAKKAEVFYKTIHNAPFYQTSLENAELIKVAYNTFIGMKIAFINTLMEICQKTEGANVDEVTAALQLAKDRIISGKYLTGGMGDGGGCHPRDNIALSWLARELDLSFDWFEAVMMAREKQTEWLAKLMMDYDLPKVILGKAFKPETNIVVGSPSILLKNILEEWGYEVTMWDPYVDLETPQFEPSVFLIGTKHQEFAKFQFPKGSVVIDPWRYIPDQDGITIIRVGE